MRLSGSINLFKYKHGFGNIESGEEISKCVLRRCYCWSPTFFLRLSVIAFTKTKPDYVHWFWMTAKLGWSEGNSYERPSSGGQKAEMGGGVMYSVLLTTILGLDYSPLNRWPLNKRSLNRFST